MSDVRPHLGAEQTVGIAHISDVSAKLQTHAFIKSNMPSPKPLDVIEHIVNNAAYPQAVEPIRWVGVMVNGRRPINIGHDTERIA